MNLTPINGNIVVKIVKEEKKRGNILIASDTLQITNKFIVKIPASMASKVEFSVGDKVIVEKYKGQSFMEDDEEYMLVKYEDIIAYEKTQ